MPSGNTKEDFTYKKIWVLVCLHTY